MKSCGDPSAFLSKESVLVVTKAAVSSFASLKIRITVEQKSKYLTKTPFTNIQELFISYLTQQTHKKCAHKKDLNYNDLSSFVQEEEKLEFLHQIVPKKITVKEFREILERGSDSEDSEDDASSSESENSDGEEVEEEEDEDDDEDDDNEDGGGEFAICFCSDQTISNIAFTLNCVLQKWTMPTRVTATTRRPMKIDAGVRCITICPVARLSTLFTNCLSIASLAISNAKRCVSMKCSVLALL